MRNIIYALYFWPTEGYYSRAFRLFKQSSRFIWNLLAWYIRRKRLPYQVNEEWLCLKRRSQLYDVLNPENLFVTKDDPVGMVCRVISKSVPVSGRRYGQYITYEIAHESGDLLYVQYKGDGDKVMCLAANKGQQVAHLRHLKMGTKEDKEMFVKLVNMNLSASVSKRISYAKDKAQEDAVLTKRAFRSLSDQIITPTI